MLRAGAWTSTKVPRTKNRAAWPGYTAASTPGLRSSHGVPAAAMLTNQTSVAGPKIAPTRAVPRFWTRNSAATIAIASGTTARWIDGATTSRPSTALSTEMAGVIIPSP